jgi:hypothetical protein
MECLLFYVVIHVTSMGLIANLHLIDGRWEDPYKIKAPIILLFLRE